MVLIDKITKTIGNYKPWPKWSQPTKITLPATAVPSNSSRGIYKWKLFQYQTLHPILKYQMNQPLHLVFIFVLHIILQNEHEQE